MSDKGGEVPVRPQETKIEHRFASFSQAQHQIQEKLLDIPISEIVSWDSDAASATTFDISSPLLRQTIEESVQQYISQEKSVSLWTVLHGFHGAELEVPLADRTPEARQRQLDVVPALVTLVNNGSPLELSEEQLGQIEVRRTHGGFAIIAPPEVVQQLAGVSYETATGGQPTTTAVVDAMRSHTQFGFALPKSETASIEGAPEGGMDIILVAKTDATSIDDVIRHEEGELLGMHIEEGVRSLQEKSKSLFGHGYDKEAAGVLSDMASRFEQEGQESFLGASGLTKAYAQAHPRETALLSLLHKRAAKLIQEDPQNRQRVVDDLRGAFLNPKQLLEVWYKGENVPELLEQEELRVGSEDFQKDLYGDDGNSPVFTSSREGRFMYVRPTLSERGGNPEVLGENALTVTLPDGSKKQIYVSFEHKRSVYDDPQHPSPPGYGAVYEARSHDQPPKTYIIKEVNAPYAEALQDHLDDVLKASVGRPTGAEQLQYLLGFFGPQSLKDRFIQEVNDVVGMQAIVNGRPTQVILQDQYKTALEHTIALERNAYEYAQQNFEREYRIHQYLCEQPPVRHFAKFVGLAEGQSDPIHKSHGEHTYYAQQAIDGKNLDHVVVNPAEPNHNEKVIAMGEQLLEALVDMHSKGVIHRDVKPPNVKVSHTGKEYTLFDVGEAVVIDDQLYATLHISREYIRTGTPPYVAPEIHDPKVRVTDYTGAVDVFAMGALLYEQVTGVEFEFNPKFPDNIDYPTAIQVVKDAHKDALDKALVKLGLLSTQGNPLPHPSPFAGLILKALQYDPKDRPSAVTMLQELRDLRQPSSKNTIHLPQPGPGPSPRPNPGPNVPLNINQAPIPTQKLAIRTVDIRARYNTRLGSGIDILANFNQMAADLRTETSSMPRTILYETYYNYAVAMREIIEASHGVIPEGVYNQWANVLGRLRQVPISQNQRGIDEPALLNEVNSFISRVSTAPSTQTLLTAIVPLVANGLLEASDGLLAQAQTVDRRLIGDILMKGDIVNTPWCGYLKNTPDRIEAYLTACEVAIDPTRVEQFVNENVTALPAPVRTYIRFNGAQALSEIYRHNAPRVNAFRQWERVLETVEPLSVQFGPTTINVPPSDLTKEAQLLIEQVRHFPDPADFQQGVNIALDLLNSPYFNGRMAPLRQDVYDSLLKVITNEAKQGRNIDDFLHHYAGSGEVSGYFSVQVQKADTNLPNSVNGVTRLMTELRNRNAATPEVNHQAAVALQEMIVRAQQRGTPVSPENFSTFADQVGTLRVDPSVGIDDKTLEVEVDWVRYLGEQALYAASGDQAAQTSVLNTLDGFTRTPIFRGRADLRDEYEQRISEIIIRSNIPVTPVVLRVFENRLLQVSPADYPRAIQDYFGRLNTYTRSPANRHVRVADRLENVARQLLTDRQRYNTFLDAANRNNYHLSRPPVIRK